MSLISFMVNQKGNVFYHEGMKPAGAGTLRFWWDGLFLGWLLSTIS